MKRLLKLMILTCAFMALVAPFAQMAPAQTTLYVATNGTGDGSSWANATNSIQGAINAISGAYPTNTVWVSNGVYEVGGITNYPTGTVLTNRVAIWKAITVWSANNNPTNTIIKGAGPNGPAAVRCVYMTNGSTLIGFTLTNGATLATGVANDTYGGGVWCPSANPIISNCVLTGNSAGIYGGGTIYGTLYNCTLTGNSAQYGGGALYCVLYNCTLSGNSASADGGGANNSTLYNCLLTGNSGNNGGGAAICNLYNSTLTSNSAAYGGGVRQGNLFNCTLTGNSATGGGQGGGAQIATLNNCTLVGNSAGGLGGGVYISTLYNCISWGNNKVDAGGTHNYSCGVDYTNGGSVSGNITNDPFFITNGSGFGLSHVAGNYRLRNVSPPLNAGTNFSYMTDPADARSKDLDGLRRIDRFSRQVDMGCYELMLRGTMFIGH